MSHIPQRREKDCLNCGTIVQGKYCHHCGQENIVPKESFWHMVTHFTYDITHFDSKFFATLKKLLFRPGFLTKEYMKGRRARYLHPIKMYVFTSAMFFLLFFSLFNTGRAFNTNVGDVMEPQERARRTLTMEKRLKKDTTSVKVKTMLALLKDTTKPLTLQDLIVLDDDFIVLDVSRRRHKSLEEYDSVQQTLPESDRDGWLARWLVTKEIKTNIKYSRNPDEAMKKLGDSVLHKLPYMLFVSLPLFALLLKLIYIRRRQFLYVDHGVFTVHLYIFNFIVLAAMFLLGKLDDLVHTRFIEIPLLILVVCQLIYLYKAMRNFYGQRRAKTIIKFLLLCLLSFIMMTVLFVIFMLFSAINL